MIKFLNRALPGIFSYLLKALVHPVTLHVAVRLSTHVVGVVLLVILLSAPLLALPPEIDLWLVPVVDEAGPRRLCIVVLVGLSRRSPTPAHDIGAGSPGAALV